MMQAMTQQNKKETVDLMSFYIPHVDANIAFDTVANVFQNQMEVGIVDRIEAVPKVNQTDGHAYHACFVYLREWGNGYNAQFLRNQLVEGKETRVYYMKNFYWKLFANTSVVAKLPMPVNYSLELCIPSYYTDPITLDSIKKLFDALELGCVSNVRYKQADVKGTVDVTCLVVDFQYWYHSVNAHKFQQDLDSESQVVIEPVFSETYPDMQWSVNKLSSEMPSANPYIYYK